MSVDVLIYLPYALEDAAGNSVTALRLRKQLIKAGLSVVIVTPRDELVPAKCLVALNAWRSAEVVRKFCGQKIVLLTGTDINDPRVGDQSWEGRGVMEIADQLVVLQEAALKKVPESLREKTKVILPSVTLPVGLKYLGNEDRKCRVLLGGRLRPEKQADLVLVACRLLPAEAQISVEWFGATSSQTAPHFQWKGPVAQEELWSEMSQADLFLNASSEEGGANAVCEAISLGLPVIASEIGGNIGLLGANYPGYFPATDAGSLSELLLNPPIDALKRNLKKRQPLFSYEREAKEWVELVTSLLF